MAQFIKTQAYVNWIEGLRDRKGRGGDAKSLGDDVHEMRIHFGPGYRVYYAVFGETIILLGGDKSTQVRDVKTAKRYAQIWKVRSEK